MNRFCVMIMVVIGAFVCIHSNAQGSIERTYAELVEPVHIEATFDQTTNLLFPYAVTSADWGSNGIIVQKRKGAKNILHVKAAKKDFTPTNLSVVTSDGKFYPFVIHYVNDAESLSYQIGKEMGSALVNFSSNEELLNKAAEDVRQSKPFMRLVHRTPSARIGLTGVYSAENNVWLKMRVHNYLLIDFHFDYVRFFVRDKKVTKRKVVYEKELVPVYADHIDDIDGGDGDEFVFGFASLNVPKNKRLVIQVGGHEGETLLQLKLKGKHLRRGKPL